MIFTTKAEYGVRLLVELGRQASEPGRDGPVSLKAIAEAEGLPLAYLERIVALLKKADLVEATRGAHGGYRLTRRPSEIRMDEVVLALEGGVAPMTCFVDDDGRPQGVLCSHHGRRGPRLRDQAAVDARPGRRRQGACARPRWPSSSPSRTPRQMPHRRPPRLPW